jgi:hypothetical protein
MVLGLAVTMAACSQTEGLFGGAHACTDIGCRDGLTVQVTGADGDFRAGTHTLEVTADGLAATCTFPMPPAATSGGAVQGPSCPASVMVSIVPATTCTESRGPNDVSQTCTPIPGQHTEMITVYGTPSAVQLRQTVDGAVVFDRQLTPAYRTSQPNGPGCEPICRQASEAWTLAAP